MDADGREWARMGRGGDGREWGGTPMDADQFPHRETPKVGRSPFPLRESEGRALPELPPGIPTGFCHEARGCAAEALPRVKAKDINNPEGVVPMVRMGGM